jgi:oligoendopeptidase F
MMNFDGSQDSVSTLAHELGHAFHNVVLAPRTPDAARLPMALAETASIFCETLLFEHAAAGATDDAERLALLDVHLVGATQTGRRHSQPVPVRDRAVLAPAPHRACRSPT